MNLSILNVLLKVPKYGCPQFKQTVFFTIWSLFDGFYKNKTITLLCMVINHWSSSQRFLKYYGNFRWTEDRLVGGPSPFSYLRSGRRTEEKTDDKKNTDIVTARVPSDFLVKESLIQLIHSGYRYPQHLVTQVFLMPLR